MAPVGGEVKIIAGWQHEHLAGAKAITRHIRNGHELKPLMEQLHYDFNYQETKQFKNEVTLKAVSVLFSNIVFSIFFEIENERHIEIRDIKFE